MLDNARTLTDLRGIPGSRLEKLAGDRIARDVKIRTAHRPKAKATRPKNRRTSAQVGVRTRKGKAVV